MPVHPVARPAIVLERMPQQLEVRARDDDWTGINSTEARRKLQNRLNQRLYRKRRRAKNPSEEDEITQPTSQDVLKPLSDGASSAVQDLTIARSCSRDQGNGIEYYNVQHNKKPDIDRQDREYNHCDDSTLPIKDLVQQNSKPSIHSLSPSQLLQVMTTHETRFSQAYMYGSPRVDQLLTLIQFNVLRALFSNAAMINCATAWLEEDAISPWYDSFASPSSLASIELCSTTTIPSCPISAGETLSVVPKYLLPTPLQRTIRHHPWIDLFPFPAMRDNLLLAGLTESYDEWDLCNDLVDFYDVTHERTGLVVWTSPWDPAGWEVSQPFLEKWGWVVRDCNELLASTRRWRRMRGEDLLFNEQLEGK